MIDKIVWQPHSLEPSEEFNKYDFVIYLDWNFAKEMMEHKISEKIQHSFSKEIGLKVNCSFPLSFYDNTSLLNFIDLGQNGRWLTINNQNIDKLKKNQKEILEYVSHNIDNLVDQNKILSIFQFWVYYSPSLLNA